MAQQTILTCCIYLTYELCPENALFSWLHKLWSPDLPSYNKPFLQIFKLISIYTLTLLEEIH